ncbi:Transcriptional regulator [Halomonas sp. NYA30]|jgi:prophage regulatory protein
MNIEALPKDQKLITKPNLCRAMDMTRSGVDRLLKTDPNFPRPLKFGDSQQSTCYFSVSEFNAWLEAKLAERGAA